MSARPEGTSCEASGPPRSAQELLSFVAERRKLPVGVHLQIADRCNHKCVHCYQVQGLKGELDFEGVCRVLETIARAGVLLLTVSGGEATLREDLLPVLRHARSLGFALRLFTNGFGLEEAMLEELASVGLLEVHISLYSASAEEHDAVTRVPGSWGETVATIRGLRERGVRVVLKTPALNSTTASVLEVRSLAEKWGCETIASALLTPREDGRLDPLEQQASPKQLAERGLLRPWLPPKDHEAQRAARLAAGSCGVGGAGLVVLSNGDVLPCSDTPLVLGNLTQQELSTLARDAEGAALFSELRWGDVRGCRVCELVLACQRCHATALHTGGDYLGPYEGACERARARYELGLGEPLLVLPQVEGADPEQRSLSGPYRIEARGVLRQIEDLTQDGGTRAEQVRRALREAAPHGQTHGDGGAVVPLARLTSRVAR